MADTPPKAVKMDPPGKEKEKVENPNAPKRSRGRPKGSTTGVEKMREPLTEFFGALAIPFYVAGDLHCGQIMTNGAQPMADAWINVAKQNAGVKRILEGLTQGSAWGAVFMSTAAVAIPIANHHGARVPNPFSAVVAQAERETAANGTDPLGQPVRAGAQWSPDMGAHD
jgi:hypothetical protein